MPGRPRAASEYDKTDLGMLEILLDDGRISIADLARRVNVSRANAYERLARMRAAGVLSRFTVEIDHAKIGPAISAIILVSVASRLEFHAVASAIKEMPEVEFSAFVTGESDLLMLVRVRDVDALRTFVMDRMQTIPGLQKTVTSIVLEDIVKRPAILPA